MSETTGDSRRRRRYVLAGIVVALGVLTGGILLQVLGTILFALTVAYVLLPVQGWLVRRGLTEWTGALAATLIGFLTAVAVFTPIVVALYFRIEPILEAVESLPRELSITVLESTHTLEAGEVQALAVDYLSGAATSLALELPVLAIKFALFVVLLFGLLLKGEEAGRAAVAPVPHGYRDVVYALAKRARETLYAIYVLQVATSVATLAIAYPLFWVLGYDAALTLSITAAVLQFVPIIGPSMLIAPITLYHVAAGDLLAATLIGVLGLVLIAWLPDIVVRPRLSRRSAGLPGSLYFVGFTGGLFTLGPIGIVVGPLIVAVFVEAVDLLSDEVNPDATFADLVEADLETQSDDTVDTETTFEESESRTVDD
ncbi:AI-2E family transporter [Natrinema longum]|uniref:AI-2E family transporter n=1 Tax=Natrinema longum TaxID=370324 RepID=A0A8A2U577_9EURY|nr:AI-2E family transporter [Natrinema longum]MBZ6495044.1 AI-2E family transporter [Natrinema longum]QSW83662.1 AI-2E family transporter [Natrinema longum]